MNRLLLVSALAILWAAPAQAQKAQIVGIGASSCTHFLEEIRRDPASERDYFAWAQGFMSGIAARAPSKVDEGVELGSKNLSLAEQAAFLRKLCAQEKQSDFPEAVLSLFRELRRRSAL